MEKLIELLDEYRKQNPREFFGDEGSLVVLTGKDFIELNRLIIISKEYGFIKYLVENDKIEASEIMLDDRMGTIYDKTDSTLMMLAIQDNPIEYLLSVIK